jgi:hypothetical protein
MSRDLFGKTSFDCTKVLSNSKTRRCRRSSLLSYELDYAAAEQEGCSAKLALERGITLYVKLFKSPKQPVEYYAGDQHGIFKKTTKSEFDFWLDTLVEKKAIIEEIQKKINLGKKY